MTLNKCKMRGGDLTREGGFFLCDHCGSKADTGIKILRQKNKNK